MAQNKSVTVIDGRHQHGEPNCIIIASPEPWIDPLFITAEIWNEYTNNVKIRGNRQNLLLTRELYNALKKASIEKPDNTPAIPSNTIITDDNTCTRCGGLGIIEAYKHINGGMCFECNGSGKKQ